MSERAEALGGRDRRLLRLTAAIVLGNWAAVGRERAEAPPGEPDRAWREAVLQAHLFCGFPRLVEAYAVLREAGGLGQPDPDEARGEPDLEARGAVLFDHIYRDQAGAIRALLRGAHPDFERWVLGHAYGRVLTRPGLTADRRELLAVASLAATAQDRQLASHARGAVRCGARVEEVHAAVEAIAELVGPERASSARRVLARFARS